MNPRSVGWHSRRRDRVSSKYSNSQSRAETHKSAISLRSEGRKSKESLSKLVWERHHASEVPVKSKNHRNSTTSVQFATPVSSSRQGSYELELINRRLHILGDGFLDLGDDPLAPIQLTISPASSDLLGPEISEGSITEIDIPRRTKRNFVSLRRSSGLSQARRSLCESVTQPQPSKYKSEVGIRSDISKDFSPFCFTNDTHSLRNQTATDYLSNGETETQLMTSGKDSTNTEISPWEGNPDDETIACDKGTSPIMLYEDPDVMTPEIKVFQTRNNARNEAPKYPFETVGKSKNRKPSRSAIHNGLLRSHRLQHSSHPSVVSSTQQLLCLTPSRGGVITLGSQDDLRHLVRPTESNRASVQVKRFNEHETTTNRSNFATVVTRSTGDKTTAYRLMQKENPSRPHTSGIQGHPFALSNLHYKHTTQIWQPYRYSATPPSAVMQTGTNLPGSRVLNTKRHLTATSAAKLQPGTAYRYIENHMKQNRKNSAKSVDTENVANVYPYQPSFNIPNTATQARKMAPVLRVVPALPRTANPILLTKPPKSPIETEPASQKRVRFSDQIGLPLVRNATPNYRRKHSYILRWLETAGRPGKPIGLPLA